MNKDSGMSKLGVYNRSLRIFLAASIFAQAHSQLPNLPSYAHLEAPHHQGVPHGIPDVPTRLSRSLPPAR